jgi:secondary thiamine-phosphate synthase enzyme
MRREGDTLAQRELSAVTSVAAAFVATATLVVETGGPGFTEITQEAARFLDAADAQNGTLLIFIRHTSASLVVQENADPDVRGDLASALARLAPVAAGWAHDSEGPDDMPAHVKAMLTGVSLHVPVITGALALGRWQGIYVAEHRSQPHRREIVLQFVGSRR